MFMTSRNDIDRVEFRRKYEEEELNDKQLAAAFDISTWIVQQIRKELSLVRQAYRHIDYQRMEALYYLGWSDVDVAGDVGCSSVTVGNWRNSKKLPINGERYRKMIESRNRNKALVEEFDSIRTERIGGSQSLYNDTAFLEEFFGKKL